MLDTIHHRGPDGSGAHMNNERGVAMGHTRLSIIDLNTGEQPLQSQDESLSLTVNGEFYDFKKHRSHAMAEGDRFRCKSDSEIALTLYRKHGLSFVDHLRGEFAFALYDRADECLYLVRDRFGVKPLYWTKTDQGLVFGSELKVLFANADVSRRFEPSGLYHQLMQTVVPGSTAFDGIYQIKPGHFLRVRRRDGRLVIEQKQYWDIEFPHAGDHRVEKDEQDYIDAVRHKLIEAVDLRLEADVPVGCYLSGGIDSDEDGFTRWRVRER
jgi:asparagine synthase (glutamine-hydrolysing)